MSTSIVESLNFEVFDQDRPLDIRAVPDAPRGFVAGESADRIDNGRQAAQVKPRGKAGGPRPQHEQGTT